MILVDSSVWIAYFNGVYNWQTDRLDHLLQEEQLMIGDIILAEVLQGFRHDRDFRRAKSVLTILPCQPLCGYEIAIKSAANYRILRKKGITIRKTIDMIIATYCIQNQLSLLHDDRDFETISEHLELQMLKG